MFVWHQWRNPLPAASFKVTDNKNHFFDSKEASKIKGNQSNQPWVKHKTLQGGYVFHFSLEFPPGILLFFFFTFELSAHFLTSLLPCVMSVCHGHSLYVSGVWTSFDTLQD